MLTITEMLRKKGVVDKFVEFFGDGLAGLPLADRATIANMAPEFGSTCGIFPIDEETIRYLELTGRSAEQIALVEAYARAQGLWRTNGMREADYTDVLELDLATVEPSLAGPKRPQDRVPLRTAKDTYRKAHAKMAEERAQKNPGATGKGAVAAGGKSFEVADGAVLIAAITSCTNTSNPAVLVAAGLLARNARKLGLVSKPWVKTSLAPGSRVVTDYLKAANLLDRPRGRGLLRRGLRLHHLHRQLGPAAPGDLRRREGRRRDRHVGAVGQPQLRGPRAPRGEDELPRLAAAGGRLRAGGHDGHRPERRAARHWPRTASRST